MIQAARIAAALGLAALAGLALLEPIGWLDRMAAPTYVEGWIADHAARLARGGLLYDPSQPLHPYNYPPLYAIALAELGGSEQLIALGRKLALTSSLLATLAIYALARALPLPRLESASAALFSLAFFAGVFPGYVASNDPTLPGTAISVAALAVFARFWRQPGGLLAAAGLVALAGLLKHNLVAAPLAMTAFLALRDRRALLRWLAIAGALLAVLLLALWASYGSAFFEILLGPRRTGLDHLLYLLPKRLPPLAPAFVIAVSALVVDRTTDRSRLVGAYLASALLAALVFSLGDGVHHNVFYDVVVALSLGLGIAIERCGEAARRSPGAWRRALLLAAPALAALPLFLDAPRRLSLAASGTARRHAAERETRLDLAHLRLALAERPASDATLLCETPAFCYWAGRPVGVDLFNARQAFLMGALEEADLLRRIAQHEFAVIQLEGVRAGPWHDRMSAELLKTIGDHYRVLRQSDNGYFFHPPAIVSRRDVD